jgi:hypothetical protein
VSDIPSAYDHSAQRTIACRYTVLDPSDVQTPTTPAAIGSQPSVSSGTSTSIPSSLSASMTNISGSLVSATRGSPLSAGQSLQTLASPNDPSSAPPPSPSSGSPSSNNSQSPGTADSNHSRPKTLVVATASIGALLGLAIASLLFVLLNRRRRKRRDGSSLSPFPVDPTLPPQLPTGKPAWPDSPSASSGPDHEQHAESSSSVNHAELFAQFVSALADNGDHATAPPPYQPRRTSRPPPI